MAATLVTSRGVTSLQTALNAFLAGDTTQQIYSIDFVVGDQTTLQGVEFTVAFDTVTGGVDLGANPFQAEVFNADSPADLEDLIDTWVATKAGSFIRGPWFQYLTKRRRLKDYYAIMLYSDDAVNAPSDWFVDATQKGGVQALTDGANIAIDLTQGDNFSVTLEGNRQLDFPVPAPTPGQSGRITVTQDGTGNRLLTYEAGYVFAGGASPVLSVAASAVDVLEYYVLSETQVLVELTNAAVA